MSTSLRAGDPWSPGDSAPELSCRELVDTLDAYVAGELAGERRLRCERHLAGCADCRAYLASYRSAIALGRAALQGDEEDVPDALVDSILAALEGPV